MPLRRRHRRHRPRPPGQRPPQTGQQAPPDQPAAAATAPTPGQAVRQPGQESRRPAGPPQPRRKTVLVIEDNATLGGLIVALLREEGYRSLRAWSLHEAVRLSRDRRPDALVLELGLPYREGLPLIGELRAQDGLETAPILVVTGNQLDLRPDEASQIEEVMTKPVDIDRLINRVRRALGDPEYAIPEKGYGAGYDPSLSTW